jgi:uridine kinase
VVTARLPTVESVASDIAAAVLAAPATLGAGRLVCVDGPAGSGKTTLADALERCFRDTHRVQVRLLHMDDVFGGWSGLGEGMRVVATDVVAPLRRGQAGHFRPFDWDRNIHAEDQLIEPCEVLVVEGVGSGNAAYADDVTCLVWVEAPSVVRLERGVARDGEHMRERWLAWRVEEDAMFARERTRERADVVVDGTR